MNPSFGDKALDFGVDIAFHWLTGLAICGALVALIFVGGMLVGHHQGFSAGRAIGVESVRAEAHAGCRHFGTQGFKNRRHLWLCAGPAPTM